MAIKLSCAGRQLDRSDSQLVAAERLLSIILSADAQYRYQQATLDRRAQEALRKIGQARAETRATP